MQIGRIKLVLNVYELEEIELQKVPLPIKTRVYNVGFLSSYTHMSKRDKAFFC